MRSLASFGLFLLCGSAMAEPVTVAIRLKARVPMAELARQVQDPHSPRYRKFFSPEEIRQVSGPGAADYAAFLRRLRKEGFTIVGESPTHLWVSAQVGAKLAEKVFSTRLRDLPGGRHQLLARSRVPQSWDQVAGITGLDSSVPRHANFRFKKAPAGDEPEGLPAQKIRSVYGVDAILSSGITGAGQHISIATYDDTNLGDISTYFTAIGAKPLPVVEKIQFNGVPYSDDSYNLETTMDAELAGMMAPGASIHIFTSAKNDDASEAQMFTAILDDNRAKIVNYSWSSCERILNPAHRQEMDVIFERAIAQGVNLLVSSGDLGASACPGDTSIQAGWPTTSPNVISVGGTTLRFDGDAIQETVWGPCGALDGCSGGGASTLYARPQYQKALSAPFGMRSIPDIAFNADLNVSGEPIWITYGESTGWVTVGGTSMAAPQWCGLLALVEEGRQVRGKPPLGFLNPLIYGMNETQRASILRDIVTGTNGQYEAGPGWDAVTGWGTPKGAALLDFLLSQ